MAFVENFLKPLFQLVITFFLMGMTIFGLFILSKKLFRKQYFQLKMFIKYKILNREINEEMVQWAMDNIENETPQDELWRTFLLTNKFDANDFGEGMYIYYKVLKQLKGGIW